MDFQGSCVYTLSKLCDKHVNLPDFNVEVSTYYFAPTISYLTIVSKSFQLSLITYWANECIHFSVKDHSYHLRGGGGESEIFLRCLSFFLWSFFFSFVLWPFFAFASAFVRCEWGLPTPNWLKRKDFFSLSCLLSNKMVLSGHRFILFQLKNETLSIAHHFFWL